MNGSAGLANQLNDELVFMFVPPYADKWDGSANGKALIDVFENETAFLSPLIEDVLVKGFGFWFIQSSKPTALRAARQMAWGTEFDVCEMCTISSVQTWPSGKICLGTNQAVVPSTTGDFSIQ